MLDANRVSAIIVVIKAFGASMLCARLWMRCTLVYAVECAISSS